MKLGRKNKHMSYIRDLHSWNESALFGGFGEGGGGVNSKKIRKIEVFLT